MPKPPEITFVPDKWTDLFNATLPDGRVVGYVYVWNHAPTLHSGNRWAAVLLREALPPGSHFINNMPHNARNIAYEFVSQEQAEQFIRVNIGYVKGV